MRLPCQSAAVVSIPVAAGIGVHGRDQHAIIEDAYRAVGFRGYVERRLCVVGR